ncbi:hypothetical protein B0H11DRAFT_2107261 [Mycena galericulata]|nr:hypothetical protein B0H11DRAFT_2107261 [Mycena galericulata]
MARLRAIPRLLIRRREVARHVRLEHCEPLLEVALARGRGDSRGRRHDRLPLRLCVRFRLRLSALVSRRHQRVDARELGARLRRLAGHVGVLPRAEVRVRVAYVHGFRIEGVLPHRRCACARAGRRARDDGAGVCTRTHPAVRARARTRRRRKRPRGKHIPRRRVRRAIVHERLQHIVPAADPHAHPRRRRGRGREPRRAPLVVLERLRTLHPAAAQEA